MVALLRHQSGAGRPPPEVDRAPLRLVPGGRLPESPVEPREGQVGIGRSGRPRLELVPGIEAPAGPGTAVVVAVALVVFALLGAVRLVQGPVEPSSGIGGGGAGADADADAGAAAVVADGDRVVVARPGDTLWSIAATVEPDGDRRRVVAALIEANGGDSVRIGQQIVVPARLLD